MARGETSRVTFDIKVSGVDEAKELSQLMPKIIRQFDELEKKLASVQKAQETASGGGRGGGGRKSGSSRTDVSERIIGMELGVIQGEIDSIQRLSTEYASLVNQINAYERAGNAANSLRVRAEKQHQKLRKMISDRDVATQQLNTTLQGITASEHEWSGVMKQTEVDVNALKLATMESREAIATQSDTYRNSSYVVLNAGYLMQDSPYGFRGISNNISQLVQSWELLNRRTMEMNMTNKENVTTWQALRRDLSGRMGMIFLIGSALPAALVLAERGFQALRKSSEDTNKELQETINAIDSVRRASASFRDLQGDDPLGLNQIEGQIQEGRWADSWFRQVERLEGKYKDLNDAIAGSGDSLDTTTGEIVIHNEEMRAIRDEINAIESLVENSGWALNVEQTRERLEELERQYTLIRNRAESEDPFLLSFRQLSREVEGSIRMFELAQDELAPEWFTEKSEAEILAEAERVGALLAQAMAEGHGAEAEKYKELLDSIRSAMGEGDGDQDWFDDQYDFREKHMDSLLNLQLYYAERELDVATNTNDRIEALEEIHRIKARQIKREEHNDRIERAAAELQIENDLIDGIAELRREQLIFELEFQNLLAEEGIDGATTLNDRLERLEDYYDRRASIIRNSLDDENEIKEALFQNDKQRMEEIQASEQEYHQARMELIQRTADFTVTSAQAVANFLTEDREAHFRINQVASASMAIINAHLAYAQTIGQAGFLGIPLAKIALAQGYAQAALIMSQKFRGRGGGRGGGGGFSALTSYRGFEFNDSSTSMFSSESYRPFSGSDSVSRENASMQMFPEKVQAEFTDGFGGVVSKGILKLHSEGRRPGRYWQDV